MTINRLILSALAASVLAFVPGRPPFAAELIYGNWTPAQEYQNRVAMPELFRNIEKDTGGAIKWKLIAGGQIADGKTTFTAVKDGLMQAGLAIVTYVPNAIPSVYTIYSTLIFGEDDPVAASGAALETMYLHCPSCLEELKNFNAVALSGWDSSAYALTCREPIKTPAGLKGKRIRATGGAAEMFKLAGAVPVGATLVEAVGLLQRGGLDCQYGIYDWLRTFGYGDVAKYVMDYPLGMSGPALGIFLNRDTWKSFTPEQKKVHVKYGAWLSAKMAIGNFVISNEEALKAVMKDKGVQLIKVGNEYASIPANYKKVQREANIATAKGFGVKDPAAIIDYYEQAVERWRPVSKGIGRDVDKFTDALNREVFSKLDPEKL
ncbi:MAG TPA: TRAP transporter substrate-binding protein DctP [Xanthobacteraceae bacterium]|jgi:TRAP-type C4-dicarboxylate transport system substrate-binding protein